MINFSTLLKNSEARINFSMPSQPSYQLSKGIFSGLFKLKLRIYKYIYKSAITLCCNSV